MFTLEVEKDLKLSLIESSFSRSYFKIVSEQLNYLSQWLAWPIHADSEAFILSFIEKSLHDYIEGKSLVCSILFKDELVGNISFNTISHKLKKVELGYWLSEDHQGKGIITKSVSSLISYAFSELDMEVAQISVAVENTQSRKICERLGLQLNGVINNSENLSGRIVDHAVYSVNQKQWLKTNIE